MRNIDLAGKTAVITGASQGIGLCTAQTLHAAGAQVVINYFADADGLNQHLADQAVRDLGERAIAIPADVRQPKQLRQMIETTLTEFGTLNILVNNAGILRDRSFKKMSLPEWQDVMDTNLTGVFNACKASVDSIEEGGTIVNVASLSAVTGFSVRPITPLLKRA